VAKPDLTRRPVQPPSRMVSPMAYDAGGEAGASLVIHPGLRKH